MRNGLFRIIIGREERAPFKENEGPMTYPLPEGEDLRRAVRWISASLEERPSKPLYRLIEEALFKFDLSPKDGEYLMNFFRPDSKKA